MRTASPYALGSKASGFAAVAFLALPVNSTLAVPLTRAGEVPTGSGALPCLRGEIHTRPHPLCTRHTYIEMPLPYIDRHALRKLVSPCPEANSKINSAPLGNGRRTYTLLYSVTSTMYPSINRAHSPLRSTVCMHSIPSHSTSAPSILLVYTLLRIAAVMSMCQHTYPRRFHVLWSRTTESLHHAKLLKRKMNFNGSKSGFSEPER